MNRIRRFLDWAFCPPYSGVPWLIGLYIVTAFFSLQNNGVFTGHLLRFDDHVRMIQILNWVNGAGWYDRTITRVNAPEGFTTIWSRFVDLPTAFVIIVAQNFMTQRTAALVASTVIPFTELAILFPVMRYFVRPLVGRKDSWLAIPLLTFTSIVSYRAYFSSSGFHPGEASHHAWYVILVLVVFGATTRIIMGTVHPKTPLILALSIGLLLAVGIEGFPMMASAAALMVLISHLYDRPAVAKRGAIGFAYAALIGLILLPTHQPPENWLAISFAQPSILGPILVATAALYLALAALIVKRGRVSRYLRLIVLIALAALFAAALITAFPKILDGGAAALSPEERDLAAHTHTEAMPVHHLGRSGVELASFLIPMITALTAGLFAIIAARGRRRRAVAIAYLGFAFLCSGLSEMYSRFYHHAMTTACAWLLWTWRNLSCRLPKSRMAWATSLIIFVMLGPFWMLLLPAIMGHEPFISNILLFPAQVQAQPETCDTLQLGEYLNAHFSKETLIMIPEWDSAKFLYYTNLKIDFLANYPSQNKFIDNIAFFQTTKPEVSHSIALRHKVDLVGLCADMILMNPLPPGTSPGFQDRLAAGERFPWLVPVKDGMISDYLLYSVDKTPIAKGQ